MAEYSGAYPGYTGRKRNKDWRDIEVDIEPNEPESAAMRCGECPEFVQCDGCDYGLCRRLTRWNDMDYYWTSADEECGE